MCPSRALHTREEHPPTSFMHRPLSLFFPSGPLSPMSLSSLLPEAGLRTAPASAAAGQGLPPGTLPCPLACSLACLSAPRSLPQQSLTNVVQHSASTAPVQTSPHRTAARRRRHDTRFVPEPLVTRCCRVHRRGLGSAVPTDLGSRRLLSCQTGLALRSLVLCQQCTCRAPRQVNGRMCLHLVAQDCTLQPFLRDPCTPAVRTCSSVFV